MTFSRDTLFSIALLVASMVVACLLGEATLRVKNSSMTNYDIEMWRYARELKVKTSDPSLDFVHLKSKSAVLQNVEIRLNEWGLRGDPIPAVSPDKRRILFLGASTTLGWGVREEDTVEKRLERSFAAAGQRVEVLNGGIGNYNAERYVSRFLKQLTGLNPTDIVVQYFMRDAESLPPGGGNFLLRHSQLAVTLWIAYQRLFNGSGEANFVERYRKVYEPDQPGFIVMQRELKKLSNYARERGIRLYFMMTPDVHDLLDYKFTFVHDIMRRIAEDDGYVYVDLLPMMTGLRPEQTWAMPGDPHPGAFGHKLMADAIFPVLAKPAAASAQIEK